MAEYEVQIDVTMSGSVFIDAHSEKEAREKVKNMFANVTHSDLSSFHCIHKEIIDAWKTEQETFGDFYDVLNKKGGRNDR